MRVRIPPPGAPEASPGEVLFDSHERATQLVMAMCLGAAAALVAANCGHLRAEPEPVMMEAAE